MLLLCFKQQQKKKMYLLLILSSSCSLTSGMWLPPVSVVIFERESLLCAHSRFELQALQAVKRSSFSSVKIDSGFGVL